VPTVAERILANLPPSFAPLPRPSVLAALADSFGGELTQGENLVAALLFAHWVEFADSNADEIDDLRRIAALYGLAPRDDETVEGFRAHLERYVRTYLQGTSTVRGCLRIVAEALGLQIADGDGQIDTWWTRPRGAPLLASLPAGDDAAALLFGLRAPVRVRGAPARPAELAGSVDLTKPVDLRGRSVLQVTTTAGVPQTIDLAASLDPAAAGLDAIVAVLNAVNGITAVADGGRLVIRSADAGAGSLLQIGDTAGDAAPALLGLAPHTYVGSAARAAQVTGTVDLPPSLDLSTQRFLRLVIDGVMAREIDCAGPDPAATTPAQIVAAIEAEAGPGTAALRGNRLSLSSPQPGLAGTVAVLTATSGDARARLLGDAPSYARGSDAAPARVTSLPDLSAGVDLGENARLALAIDASPPVIIDCAGADPHKTLAGEIAARINAAVGALVASQDGRSLTLTSQQSGPAGNVSFGSAPDRDALQAIFGLAPRSARGSDATSASFTGSADLAGGVDLRALQRVAIEIDDGQRVVVDFAADGLGRAGVDVAAIAAALDSALGAAVASTDGAHLTLRSPSQGSQSAIAILPLQARQRQAYVSRAFPIDDAGSVILGTFGAGAVGAASGAARLDGVADLHDGLDLRDTRFLRIALDGDAARDIDCAATCRRPRSAMLDEICAAINAAMGLGAFASIADGRLTLSSPTRGATSAIALLPNAGDAAPTLFERAPTSARGVDAQRLVFTGLANLANGIDLSVASRLRLAIDGGAAIEVDCAGVTPARTRAAEISSRINAAFGASCASTDGTFLRLVSAQVGSAASIELQAPSTGDATRAILGIPAGRSYRGVDAAPALLTGGADLPASLDLRARPWLRLAVDKGAPVLVDCRGADPARTTAAEVAARIQAAFAPTQAADASVQGARLQVVARSRGAASSIDLLPAGDGDARALLLGAALTTPGRDATPATLTGSVDLRQPVDLSHSSVVQIDIDDGAPRLVDVSGAAPDRSFGDEIVSAIDAELPGVATLDGNGHLVLTSPSPGEDSRIAVQPLRPIDLIEYPLVQAGSGPMAVQGGASFTLANDGAAESSVSFTLARAGGLGAIELVGLTTRVRLRIEAPSTTHAGLRVRAREDGGIEAIALDAAGRPSALPASACIATPLMDSARVPFDGVRILATRRPGERPALALLDPLANNVVRLESTAGQSRSRRKVRVVEADASASSAPPATSAATGALELLGRLLVDDTGARLADGAGACIARLRAAGGVAFAPFAGVMVAALGTWHADGAQALLSVETLARVFDIDVDTASFPAVTLDPRSGARSLANRLAGRSGTGIIARDVPPAEALRLPRGRSTWLLVPTGDSLFDASSFDLAHFAGGPCNAAGVFDVSRFDGRADANAPGPVDTLSRFAPLVGQGPVAVTASWQSHEPGRFEIRLPADLPPQFGAKFNGARFASKGSEAEVYSGVVLDPPDDPDYIEALLQQRPDALVYAKAVAAVPLGWEGNSVPFHQPRTRRLSGGRADRPAALYLVERDVPGAFAILARENGAWGNDISVSVRYGGPAMFEISVDYSPARFECARSIVLAGRLPAPGEAVPMTLGAKPVLPGPVGVLQAKAAGIEARVTRETT
jgi:hypothetical protein